MSIRLLSAALGLLSLNCAAQRQDAVDRVLESLLRTDANTFWAHLVESRPTPVTAEFKGAARRELPQKGEITNLKRSAKQKLVGIEKILQMHGRKDAYDIMVIDGPDAFVGLYARSVVLISLPALDHLNQEELQAAIAHEAGHEYVWSEFEEARRRDDFDRLKELELLCDAVAVITLQRAGLNPHSMVSCFEALLQYARDRSGPHPNESRYIAPAARKTFIEKAISWARAK